MSFTDDAGNGETLTSEATAPVKPEEIEETQEPPAQPTGLSGTVEHDTVSLTWDDPEDDSITGYQILRRNRAVDAPGQFQVHVEDTGSAVASYVDRDVEPDTRYVYRIKARSTAGLSERSDYFRADIPPEPEPEPEPNSPATGVPTIGGTAQVGETLTADTSGIADANGLDNATFSYQWVADDAEIQGATLSTYTLADSDEGKTIKVGVSFTDDAGNGETLTSEATAPVKPEEIEETQEPPAQPTGLSGTVEHNAVSLTWDDPEDDSITGYQILRRNRAVDAPGQFQVHVEDTGSAAASYVDRDVEPDASYVYRIKARSAAGLSERSDYFRADTPPEPEPEPEPNSTAPGAPTIGGTAQVGETLTADTSGIADADGLDNATFSYQWIVSDGGADLDIPGATGATYTLIPIDAGLVVMVRVSFTDDAGNEETLTSAATAAVTAAVTAAGR